MKNEHDNNPHLSVSINVKCDRNIYLQNQVKALSLFGKNTGSRSDTGSGLGTYPMKIYLMSCT